MNSILKALLKFCTTKNLLKRDSVDIVRQIRLLCPWTRHLTGLLLPLSG